MKHQDSNTVRKSKGFNQQYKVNLNSKSIETFSKLEEEFKNDGKDKSRFKK